MAVVIENKSNIELGVVPTHTKFVGGLAPDENGKLPRGEDGKLLMVSEMANLKENSPAKIDSVQITLFPGTDAEDLDDMMNSFKELGLVVHLIMMVGGADPMNPDDEEKVAEMLVSGLETAKKYGVTNVSSTSLEE